MTLIFDPLVACQFSDTDNFDVLEISNKEEQSKHLKR